MVISLGHVSIQSITGIMSMSHEATTDRNNQK